MARTGRIVPPLLLMGLIFYLSAQPDLNSGLGTWDAILRKGAHMTEFGLLWFLWTRVVGPFGALAISLAYAASDEFHQTFVDGPPRHAGGLGDRRRRHGDRRGAVGGVAASPRAGGPTRGGCNKDEMNRPA